MIDFDAYLAVLLDLDGTLSDPAVLDRISGWGWADNGHGAGVLGPTIYFANDGPQTIRIQTREDGLGIDQEVLSSVYYLNSSPGAINNDTTVLAETP